MNSNLDTTREYLRAIIENFVGAALLIKGGEAEISASDVARAITPEVERIIEESYPLSRLLDKSDLLVHAEGPGALREMPWLSSFAWVMGTVQKSIRKLFRAYFEGAGVSDPEKAAHSLDLRLPGIAPGSIWIGAKIIFPDTPLQLEIDDTFVQDTLSALPRLINFIGDEGILPGVEGLEMDPAQVDYSMQVLLDMSPTGNKGIHTLELSTKSDGAGRLSQRERVVLREALKNPLGKKRIAGEFVGSVRVADLDKSRFYLRTKNGVIRCAVSGFKADDAKKLIGSVAKVTGLYETDKQGRPRMMWIEHVEAVSATQADLE